MEKEEGQQSHKGQDYIFVRAFVPFVASVLIKAYKDSDDSSNDVEVILGGMTALNDEIAWFKKEATKWNVQLSEIVPQKTNQEYCRYSIGVLFLCCLLLVYSYQGVSTVGGCRYRQAIPIGRKGRLDIEIDTNFGIQKGFLPRV
ncbi:hypothetical protein SLEP1_g52167 [Rubroshorea leprosula]|uniref:Thiaminase-2/PQQC domain-containing protein n=1 Tax=Rubroshorea leprosula TaxID=152421 RepID=A0AAV5M5D7_9ROSI|nr:hypothetical protein SLEP1_g52167 [Rubroshorea leprosula]